MKYQKRELVQGILTDPAAEQYGTGGILPNQNKAEEPFRIGMK